MPNKKSTQPKSKSKAFAASHSATKGLHRIGAIDKTTLREYEVLCNLFPPPLKITHE